MSRYCRTMQIRGFGRFVFIAQWVLAVLLPVFFFLGRGFIGAEVGWVGIIGLVYGIIVIFVLLVPPLLTLFDGEVRKAKATRAGYDLARADHQRRRLSDGARSRVSIKTAGLCA